jgi:hypothetical protein
MRWLELVAWTAAFNCFSEYEMSWCNNNTEASCIHEYTFSVSHFQRKLDTFYWYNGRPPLLEAFYLVKMPRPYQMQFLESDCPAPLIFAYLLVAESKLAVADDADRYYDVARQLLDSMSAEQRSLLETMPSWPYQKAWAQYEARYHEFAWMKYYAQGRPLTLDFVIAHCREDLTWLLDEPKLPAGSSAGLWVYEKCGEQVDLSYLQSRFERIYVVPRPDAGKVRGDECSAYLTHITMQYAQLANYTIYLHSDPDQHLHFAYLDAVLASMARGTFNASFVHLNGPRHVRTLTPCLQTVHQAIFAEPLNEVLGPYCCAQFAVKREAIVARPVEFYERMLRMVDGSIDIDLCTTAATTRSTHCYGMEFMWHKVFGDVTDPPLRPDDTRLPTGLRLKFGKEHEMNDWREVMLAPPVPKKIVERVDYNQEAKR